MNLSSRIATPSLIVGGLFFIAGGITHPHGDGSGTKAEQLGELVADHHWYPSHGLLLVGMLGFAVGAAELRRRATPQLRSAFTVVMTLAIVGVLGTGVHVAAGDSFWVQAAYETFINAAWGAGFAVLAVVGGLSRTAGNTITGALGLAGGTCYAVASATIAWTDRFDGLHPVGLLLGLWAVITGIWFALRPDDVRSISGPARQGAVA